MRPISSKPQSMGICRTAWGSPASVICPSNGRGNTKPSDLPHINPIGTSQGTTGSATRRLAHGARSSDLSRQTGSATSHPRARVSATGFSVSGKGQFPAREKSENGVPNRMPFPQRRTLMSRADVDRPAKNARIITQNNKTPGDLEGCPTRGAGRTRTMFHNTLVVGSSPTSSTTQSPATGEILL